MDPDCFKTKNDFSKPENTSAGKKDAKENGATIEVLDVKKLQTDDSKPMITKLDVV
jgi:hypothetical protein